MRHLLLVELLAVFTTFCMTTAYWEGYIAREHELKTQQYKDELIKAIAAQTIKDSEAEGTLRHDNIHHYEY